MSGQLSTPVFRYLDANGDPLSGGKIYFYEPGTSTPKDTYTTYAQSVANTNPVILDSRGEAQIFGTGLYKVVIKDSSDVTIDTMDNVAASASATDVTYSTETVNSALVRHDGYDGVSGLKAVTPVNNEIYRLNYHTAFGDWTAHYYGITGTSGLVDNGSTVVLPTGGDGTAGFLLNCPQGEYHIHSGQSVASMMAVTTKMQADGYSSNKLVFAPGSYTIGSLVDLDLPENTTVFAYGAVFTCTHNGVAFDVNPDATAAIPVLTTTDTYTKRRIKWFGGYFTNSNGTKTASAAMQAYFMRDFQFHPEYVTGFKYGIKFGAKDTYDIGGYYFNNDIHYFVPTAGTLFTTSLTGNDLIRVHLGGHISCSGNTHAIQINTRVVGLTVTANINGATTAAQVKVSDSTASQARDYSFRGMHCEQMDAGLYAVEFDATGTTGFIGVEFDGTCEFVGATVGWKGVKLDKCIGVKFGSNVFVDGSGGATEEGIYVDDDSRDITIDTNATQFTTFASGQAIVLQSAANRQYITLIPELDRVAPAMLTGYNGNTFSTTTATIDMSSAFASFGNYLLPPKGYELVLTASDSGSAAAGTDAVRFSVKKPSAADASRLAVWAAGVNNSNRRTVSGYCGADDNGDIYADIAATGAGTLTGWIAVTAVHQ